MYGICLRYVLHRCFPSVVGGSGKDESLDGRHETGRESPSQHQGGDLHICPHRGFLSHLSVKVAIQPLRMDYRERVKTARISWAFASFGSGEEGSWR